MVVARNKNPQPVYSVENTFDELFQALEDESARAIEMKKIQFYRVEPIFKVLKEKVEKSPLRHTSGDKNRKLNNSILRILLLQHEFNFPYNCAPYKADDFNELKKFLEPYKNAEKKPDPHVKFLQVKL